MKFILFQYYISKIIFACYKINIVSLFFIKVFDHKFLYNFWRAFLSLFEFNYDLSYFHGNDILLKSIFFILDKNNDYYVQWVISYAKYVYL